MGKAEDYIKKSTRRSQEGDRPYNEWVSVDCAKESVEIAKEEIYEWLNEKLPIYIDCRCRGVGESVEEFVNDLKQSIKDE